MNRVDAKRPLVTELFCSVVTLKETVSPKPRVKLQQVQIRVFAIIPDYPFNKLLTASQKQSDDADIWKQTGSAEWTVLPPGARPRKPLSIVNGKLSCFFINIQLVLSRCPELFFLNF